MSIIRISGSMNGSITTIPSKSVTHRAIICAALSQGKCKISNVELSKDIQATINCIDTLGLAAFEYKDKTLHISGKGSDIQEHVLLNCGESGSTLRFMIPIATLFSKSAEFIGEGRLMERPIEPLKNALIKNGISFVGNTVSEELKCGEYDIAGNVSSQFISGLLFALPLLKGDSIINLTSELQSKPYVELTRYVQKKFGVNSKFIDSNTIEVPGYQRYTPCDMEIEGDYSHAAFFAVGGAIGGGVIIYGLLADSIQGDKDIFNILEKMGADIEYGEKYIKVNKSDLRGITIDASDIPDLVPVLAVAGAAAKGRTVIVNAARLRIKESDRLSAISEELRKLGADILETPDGLIINGGKPLAGHEVFAHNDHRIAMSLAIACAITKGEILLSGSESVSKSAINFWKEFESLGGKIS